MKAENESLKELRDIHDHVQIYLLRWYEAASRLKRRFSMSEFLQLRFAINNVEIAAKRAADVADRIIDKEANEGGQK